MGDQLLQLSGRGMNAAATLAEQMGKTEQEVRDMVSKGQISFSTLLQQWIMHLESMPRRRMRH